MGLENLNGRPLDYIDDESGERKSLYEEESVNNDEPLSYSDYLKKQAHIVMEKVKTQEGYIPNEFEQDILNEYHAELIEKMDSVLNGKGFGL